MMMSYDVTGGGPREAPIVYLSIPVLIFEQNTYTLKDMNLNVKK